MKIISHVKESKFLISVDEKEFRQILGIKGYYISKEINVDECIFNETVLELSSGFQTAEKIKNIVERKQFQDMKEKLLIAVEAIEDAEIKFCNLNRTITDKIS